MARSGILVSGLAVLASGVLVAACGGGGGTTAQSSGGGSSAPAAAGGGSAAAGGCAQGAAASGSQLTAAKEADADVAKPDSKCWASIKPSPITQVGNGTIPSGDSTTFKVAWSDKNLYIMAYTKEWPLNTAGGTNWWQSDTTEVTVSGVDDHAGTMDSNNSFQFGVVEDGSLQNGTNGSNANPAPTPQIKVDPNKGFYSELVVSWKTLGVSAPKAGQKYQFDIAEDYGDSGGNRVGQAVWAGDGTFYNNTTNWGDIKLG